MFSQPILLPFALYGELGTLILLVGVVAIWGAISLWPRRLPPIPLDDPYDPNGPDW